MTRKTYLLICSGLGLYGQELPLALPIRFVTGTYLLIACDFNCNIL